MTSSSRQEDRRELPRGSFDLQVITRQHDPAVYDRKLPELPENAGEETAPDDE